MSLKPCMQFRGPTVFCTLQVVYKKQLQYVTFPVANLGVCSLQMAGLYFSPPTRNMYKSIYIYLTSHGIHAVHMMLVSSHFNSCSGSQQSQTYWPEEPFILWVITRLIILIYFLTTKELKKNPTKQKSAKGCGSMQNQLYKGLNLVGSWSLKSQ